MHTQRFTFISSLPEQRLMAGLETARKDALFRQGGFHGRGDIKVEHVMRIADGIDLCWLHVNFECMDHMLTHCQKQIDDNVVGFFRTYEANSFVLFGLHYFKHIPKE